MSVLNKRLFAAMAFAAAGILIAPLSAADFRSTDDAAKPGMAYPIPATELKRDRDCGEPTVLSLAGTCGAVTILGRERTATVRTIAPGLISVMRP